MTEGCCIFATSVEADYSRFVPMKHTCGSAALIAEGNTDANLYVAKQLVDTDLAAGLLVDLLDDYRAIEAVFAIL